MKNLEQMFPKNKNSHFIFLESYKNSPESSSEKNNPRSEVNKDIPDSSIMEDLDQINEEIGKELDSSEDENLEKNKPSPVREARKDIKEVKSEDRLFQNYKLLSASLKKEKAKFKYKNAKLEYEIAKAQLKEAGKGIKINPNSKKLATMKPAEALPIIEEKLESYSTGTENINEENDSKFLQLLVNKILAKFELDNAKGNFGAIKDRFKNTKRNYNPKSRELYYKKYLKEAKSEERQRKLRGKRKDLLD